MLAVLGEFGRFFLFLAGSFKGIGKLSIVWDNFMEECIKIGINTILIVVIISSFTGAVSAIQTAFNLTSPYIQDFITAMVVRDTMFSLIPTLVALIYAGKVGSFISGEIGTMKITEQIDALEIMGINSKSFLVFPKIIASILMFPMLVFLGGFMSILGGYLTVSLLGIISETDYVIGIRSDFNPYIITIIFFKSILFGLLVPTIASFQGYYITGGALEVGKAGTLAVVKCCIFILIGDYLITKLLTQ